jgi:hypothetical protein
MSIKDASSGLWQTWEVSRVRVEVFIAAAVLMFVLVSVVGALASSGNSKSRRWFLLQLVEGVDGRLSTSKFQALVWTVVAIYGFVVVFIERLLMGTTVPDSSVPANLLIAMGLSATTMTAAKGIVLAYTNQGLVDKSGPTVIALPTGGQEPITMGRKGGLVTDDDGIADLSKIQMLAFTGIAVVVYLMRLALPEKTPPELVDIEPALMVLMGLSQGAYIGTKLTSTAAPRVTGISPAIGVAGATVTLTGVSFGNEQNGSVVTADAPVPEVLTWSDTKVTFKWPDEKSPGIPWQNGDRVEVAITVNGRRAGAPVQFVYAVQK